MFMHHDWSHANMFSHMRVSYVLVMSVVTWFYSSISSHRVIVLVSIWFLVGFGFVSAAYGTAMYLSHHTLGMGWDSVDQLRVCWKDNPFAEKTISCAFNVSIVQLQQNILGWLDVDPYLHKGTLQTFESTQRRACNSKSCHIRLQWTQPPGTLNLHPAKWRTSDSNPLQAS